MILVLYPSMSSTIFRTFSCESFDNGRFMREDYSIKCDSTKYTAFVRPYAIAMMIIYPIGVPLVWRVQRPGRGGLTGPFQGRTPLVATLRR